MINVGDLLVAPPQMKDSKFRQSVILMAHTGLDGNWGLCLNKGLGVSVQQTLGRVGIATDIDIELYWGGPLSQGVIWMLHDPSWIIESTIELTPCWSMTSHKEMFGYLESKGVPDHWRMFSGFAAWGPGQLESEIIGEYPYSHQSSWLLCHSHDPAWAFIQEDQDLWHSSISLSGQQAISSWL
jgi:putative transcriptional regulator